jgi:protein-S-isoprenylcysteine O-methyltransferase Ste14
LNWRRSARPGWWRLAALYAFLAILVVVSRPTPGGLAAGAALAALGEALRVWAAGHLVKSVRLVTSGPYARTRNPLYLGRLMILTGVVIAAWIGPVWSLGILAAAYGLFFAYYLPRKERVEGARLTARHGAAYAEYRDAVPALVPTVLRRFPGGGAPWSLRLAVGNREPSVALGLIALFALLSWRCCGRQDLLLRPGTTPGPRPPVAGRPPTGQSPREPAR